MMPFGQVRRRGALLAALLSASIVAGCARAPEAPVHFFAEGRPEQLSQWHVVYRDGGRLALNAAVVPYDLNERGGVKHHAVELARVLRRGGDEVTIIGPSTGPVQDPDTRGFGGVVNIRSNGSDSASINSPDVPKSLRSITTFSVASQRRSWPDHSDHVTRRIDTVERQVCGKPT